jgi:hypothetical protein
LRFPFFAYRSAILSQPAEVMLSWQQASDLRGEACCCVAPSPTVFWIFVSFRDVEFFRWAQHCRAV